MMTAAALTVLIVVLLKVFTRKAEALLREKI
jgi:hypothetical protein